MQTELLPPSTVPQKHRSSSTRMDRRKLRLNIAVNGVSKSMRGYVPISNVNLKRGDFGDDVGLFTENSQFSFVGKSKECEERYCFIDVYYQV